MRRSISYVQCEKRCTAKICSWRRKWRRSRTSYSRQNVRLQNDKALCTESSIRGAIAHVLQVQLQSAQLYRSAISFAKPNHFPCKRVSSTLLYIAPYVSPRLDSVHFIFFHVFPCLVGNIHNQMCLGNFWEPRLGNSSSLMKLSVIPSWHPVHQTADLSNYSKNDKTHSERYIARKVVVFSFLYSEGTILLIVFLPRWRQSDFIT